MEAITLENNSTLIISISENNKNSITFKCIDLNNERQYEREEEDVEETFHLTPENFIKKYNNFDFEVNANNNNGNEIRLAITNKNSKKKNVLILSEITDNGNKKGTKNAAPLASQDSPSPGNNNDWIKEFEELQKDYNDKINKIKEENAKFVQDNEELKKKIDEEKIKNDKIVRAYLEIREKYDSAVERDSDIKEIQKNI